MSASELYSIYESQGVECCSRHEDENYGDGHLDNGPGHFDYPHQDHHTDE